VWLWQKIVGSKSKHLEEQKKDYFGDLKTGE